MIKETEIGRILLCTSTEAQAILELSLSRLKAISDLVLHYADKKEERSARRYSGRDIRNLQLYLGKVKSGVKKEYAIEFVKNLDSFLEDVYQDSKKYYINNFWVDTEDIVDEKNSLKNLLNKNVLPLSRDTLSQDLISKLKDDNEYLSKCYEQINQLKIESEKLGFQFSTDTIWQCLFYLSKDAFDTLHLGLEIKQEVLRENELKQKPVDRLRKILKATK